MKNSCSLAGFRLWLLSITACLFAGCASWLPADKDYATFHEEIAGAWISSEDGTELTLFPTGQFKLQLPDSPDRVVRGSYTLDEGAITFDGAPDHFRGYDFDGTYSLRREEDDLYFTPLNTPDAAGSYTLAEEWHASSPLE